MRHRNSPLGHGTEIGHQSTKAKAGSIDTFVLEKSIFNNIFEKDIRRIFIYKKAERLAKATYLITPAFADSVSLKNRIDAIAIGLIDAAVLPPVAAREALARELLALSSILSLASTNELLSPMNAELIAREAHMLLQEIADYEEPRVTFEDAPSLSSLARDLATRETHRASVVRPENERATTAPSRPVPIKDTDVKDTKIKDRREAVLSVIRTKGHASIKDISTLIRNVSEKTIQRELISLVTEGLVVKRGERRWSTYSLV